MAPDPRANLHNTQLLEAWVHSVSFQDLPDQDSGEQGFRYGIESTITADASQDPPVVELDAKVVWGEPGEETVGPFDLQIAVAGRFRLDITLDNQDDVEELLRFNGKYLLWPYLRTYIATVTALSQRGPLTIFTIKIPSPRVLDPVTAETDAAVSDPSSTHD